MVNSFSRSLLNLGDHLSSLVRTRLWLQVMVAMALGVATGIVIGPGLNLVPASTGRWTCCVPWSTSPETWSPASSCNE